MRTLKAEDMTEPIDNQAEAVKLLACPFCGSPAYDFNPDGDMEGYHVGCSGKATVFGGDDSMCPMNCFSYPKYEDAKTAWNRRAAPASGQGVVDERDEAIRLLDKVIPFRLDQISKGACVDAAVDTIEQAIAIVRAHLQSGSASSADQWGSSIVSSPEYVAEQSARNAAFRKLLDQTTNAAMPAQQADSGDLAVKWACSKWDAEVANRPLVNVHRRTLDDTWRQVIRHFGGDDRLLIGPTHDELVSMSPKGGEG